MMAADRVNRVFTKAHWDRMLVALVSAMTAEDRAPPWLKEGHPNMIRTTPMMLNVIPGYVYFGLDCAENAS